MSNEKNIRYAQRELEVALAHLADDPDNIAYKERVSWWNSFLGNYEEAEQYAVTEKAKEFLRVCRTR